MSPGYGNRTPAWDSHDFRVDESAYLPVVKLVQGSWGNGGAGWVGLVWVTGSPF
jgi:hypothetical protein